jgi:tRNA U34 5-methylaminomethyl-2-thiouridine-forming methyltransferase MnmC
MSAEIEEFEIVTVQSGARSLRSRRFAETFHPVVGPMAEARSLHVQQSRLIERARETAAPFVIWDVGLGAAANAIAVLEAAADLKLEIHSFDRSGAPLAFALRHADELEYLTPYRAAAEALLAQGRATVGVVAWFFHRGEFGETMEDPALPAPHAVLYDPYSPATNAEMWTLDHFVRLHARLDPARPCVLTNYTRSTAVRVTLLLAGFFVGCGGATGEKEETTIAANRLDLLDRPLDRKWLERVERSTRGAPLKTAEKGAPIGAADLARLHAHPQFRARDEMDLPPPENPEGSKEISRR